MTIIDQLNRLAEIAPEVCRVKFNGYHQIGEYRFNQEGDIFRASCEFPPHYNVYHADGRPALAWLRDALEQVIEARGWSFSHLYNGDEHRVDIPPFHVWRVSKDPAEALLAALIAALGEGKG